MSRSHVPSRPSFAAFLIIALGSLACGSGEPPVPRHVLFITVDTLRADHLSLQGYPRRTSPGLEALAQEGVVFERAFAQWPLTGTSFASIFTGHYPQTTRLVHRADIKVPLEYIILPELFEGAGFTTTAVVSNAMVGKDLLWDIGFDEFHETWAAAGEVSDDPLEFRRWINARRVNELALPMLERHRDADRLFAWIHYSDPHGPYVLPDDVENPFLGDEYYVGPDEEVVEVVGSANDLGPGVPLKHYVAQYDANILFMDRYVTQLLDHVRSLGMLEDALVIFTADHGEVLGEGLGRVGHGPDPHNSGVHVPLVISYPPALERGLRIRKPVDLVDLYPTLQEWLVPERPMPNLDGESLMPFLTGDLDALAERGRHVAISAAGSAKGRTHFRTVQDTTRKVVYHPPARRGGHEMPSRWHFYDLEDDPLETRDLASVRPDPFRPLARHLKEWLDGEEWIRTNIPMIQERNEETLKALRALGYVD